jgi:hypothetical protein
MKSKVLNLAFTSILSISSFFVSSIGGNANAQTVKADIDLESPPVVSCLTREGKERKIQSQLVQLEIIIYNWKRTQGDVIRLISSHIEREISTNEFDIKMTSLISRLNELTNMLDKATDDLTILVKEDNNLVGSLPEEILAQKHSGLLYLRVILGSNEATFQEARLQYHSSWASFAQAWNMVYGIYGCSSTNPWATF